jgi:hypothetical protein
LSDSPLEEGVSLVIWLVDLNTGCLYPKLGRLLGAIEGVGWRLHPFKNRRDLPKRTQTIPNLPVGMVCVLVV